MKYRITIEIETEIDSSVLLESAQAFADELCEDGEALVDGEVGVSVEAL